MQASVANASEVVGFLTAGGALLASGWRGYKAYRAHRARVRREHHEHAQQFATLTTAVSRMEPMVTSIQRELTANGGGSLRDAITDLRNQMAIDRAARRMVQNVPSLELGVADREPVVLAVSHAFVRLTGLTRDDCERDGWLRCVVPADRERVGQIVREAYESEHVVSTTYAVEHVHTRTATHVEHTGTPVLNYAGAVVGWIFVLRPREVGP